MPHALLVYNPTAGRYPSGLLAGRAAQQLERHGWQVDLEQTESGEHIKRLAQQAAEQGLDALFVAGGDGSLNQAISGLYGSETALGVLPAGTANVWAQELGLPGLTWTRWTALEESARMLAEGNCRTIDIGLCNGKPYLLWAGVGLDAFIVHHIEPRTRWEKHFAVVQYAASAIWNASAWRGMNLKAVVDDRTIEGHFLLGVLSNIHLYAGGYLELTPHARLDDGWMDLWLFKGETLGDTVQVVWDLFSGGYQDSERVLQIPFKSLRLSSDSPLFVQVDGEPLDVSGEVAIEVAPCKLKVLVPGETPHPLFL